LATTLMSVCILVAQLVMVPVALLVGAKADIWGRKPIFLVGLAVLASAAGSMWFQIIHTGSLRCSRLTA
jgi:MFS family permease